MLRAATILGLVACADPVGDGPVDDGYSSCEPSVHVGGFYVEALPTYTAVQGSVADGVAPYVILEERLRVDDCSLMHPRELFCDPTCGAGTTCDVDGSCVALPSNQDVGPVEVVGLGAVVVMEAIAPTQTYYFAGDLPHPAVAVGDRLELYSGASREGLAMLAFGVDDLLVDGTTMDLRPGEPSLLTWKTPGAQVDTRVHVAVDIANHGGVPARIVCETADDGQLQIDAGLVDGLIAIGHSGFPTVTLIRRSSDTAMQEDGCVDFSVRSSQVLDVDIPGLISCSGPEDCPEGQTCQPDLQCG